jgi:hypothetical protein
MKSQLAIAAALVLLTTAASAAPPVAEPPPATKGPVDGLVSSPDNFKLLLENDHVRVLQYTLLPGQLDHWHTHPPRVGYVLSGAKIRVTEADGSHQSAIAAACAQPLTPLHLAAAAPPCESRPSAESRSWGSITSIRVEGPLLT